MSSMKRLFEAFDVLERGLIPDDGTGTKNAILRMRKHYEGDPSVQDVSEDMKLIGCVTEWGAYGMSQLPNRLRLSICCRYTKNVYRLYEQVLQYCSVENTLLSFAYVVENGYEAYSKLPKHTKTGESVSSWYDLEGDASSNRAWLYFGRERKSIIELLSSYMNAIDTLGNPIWEACNVATHFNNNLSHDTTYLIMDLFHQPRKSKIDKLVDDLRMAAFREDGVVSDDIFDNHYETLRCCDDNSLLDLYYAIRHGVHMLRKLKEDTFIKRTA